MKTKIDKMRDFFRENPNATQRDAAVALVDDGLTSDFIKAYAYKDIRSGRAEKIYINKDTNDWTLDYSKLYESIENQSELNEWKKEIQIKLIDQLIAANERETNSEKIRMNAKVISQLLKEV